MKQNQYKVLKEIKVFNTHWKVGDVISDIDIDLIFAPGIKENLILDKRIEVIGMLNKWQPKPYETIWAIDICEDDIICATYSYEWQGDWQDQWMLELGLIFKTEQEAKNRYYKIIKLLMKEAGNE